MKKIAMFTMGTRGDVQPYIYLSRELKRHGYEVTLGSHPCWGTLIKEAGIRFVPIGPDIDIEKETTIIRGKTSNPVFSMLKTMNFVFKIVQEATGDVYKACEGMDLIIVSHSQIGATEAEVLQIPIVNVTLQTEMIAEKQKEQNPLQKAIGAVIAAQVAKPYNKIRKVYGLPKVKSSDEILSKQLNLIPISKYVKERNPYWEAKNVMTGYWYEEEPDYTPDAALKNFLDSGERPVILALGAMSFETESEKEKLDIFVNAFQRTGMRAVIQGFKKTLAAYDLPDTMISCESVPHSWLFRQGYCVIHHCGFGTASATLIYAIPSIPIPHVLDQMGFANELFRCGAATEAIPSKQLNEETLVHAIEEMKRTYKNKKERVCELADKIQSEHGVEYAVELIEKLL